MIISNAWQTLSSLVLYVFFLYLARKYHNLEYKQDVVNVSLYYGIIIGFELYEIFRYMDMYMIAYSFEPWMKEYDE